MQGNPPPYSSGPPPTVVHGVQPVGVVHTVQSGTTVIHTNAGIGPVFIASNMGPMPANMACRSCGHEIVTRVDAKPSLKTHLFAALLCLIGCWPCVCIPYCANTCYNADHYCPNCSAYIGTYIH
ncbi:lipopolysaccharide-induced tumor necrosis factor-alpha factor homolog isoform X2 [Trichoplusia ni]|nr:lipopolysaccharide-induced tumor necrosis factor-alpha factor homolog isoform X2 [Trichoplusia ni]XP_026746504.1 lipopolysaccharide-induced tumor necrosis factor-alpha factor homolog isoform X2 [Trichoplusia ni]XP_026746509.1 lipopolysaccharide-induced tumor necrosis factor-alpha factor homolog isoform X2 [Trichoplusia ni]